MLECPDCDRGFEPDVSQYVRFLTLGAVYCPQCSARCMLVVRRRNPCPLLPTLRFAVLSGLFLCSSYLALHILFLLADPWLLLDVPRSRTFVLATCGAAAIIASGFLVAGYYGQKLLLNSHNRELARCAPEPSDDRCPICGSEPGHDVIAFGDVRVCPQCKDEYIQRLREGVPS